MHLAQIAGAFRMTNVSRRTVLAITGAALSMPSLLRAQSGGTVKIGAMLPLSGPASIEGHQVLKGV